MMNTPLPGAIGGTGQVTGGIGMNASVGYGNYNGLFFTMKSQDWHGVTMQSNFTWSKALGTGAEIQATSENTPPDPFNLRTGYGYQDFDRRFVYNLFFVYQPHFYKSQSGFLGHLAGGWTIAPVFTAGSGSASHSWHHQRWPSFRRRRWQQLPWLRDLRQRHSHYSCQRGPGSAHYNTPGGGRHVGFPVQYVCGSGRGV